MNALENRKSYGKPFALPNKTSSCEVRALKVNKTVQHSIGFSKHSVNWFRSYLINRTFLVNLGNAFSQPANVSSGVLQESILGPLLFLIYINMSQAVKCNIFLYADDTCLVC